MGRKRSTKPTSNQYINAHEFAEELRSCQENGVVSEKMYRFFQLLARKCSGAFIYTSNEDRMDCVSNAVTVMARAYMKFDFNRKAEANAFSYFTSVALNGLRQGWNELNAHSKNTYRIDQIFSEHL